MKYYIPLDPNCPAATEYICCLVDDEMTKAMGAPVDEILEDFERRHRLKCKRCQEYGAANIEVTD
jgi:hypothetical protein